jgi:hypothetical protein
MGKALTTEEFIKKANEVHFNKYNYDKTEYKHSLSRVIITCPIHGDFTQLPARHLFGEGCPECKRDNVNSHFKKPGWM